MAEGAAAAAKKEANSWLWHCNDRKPSQKQTGLQIGQDKYAALFNGPCNELMQTHAVSDILTQALAWTYFIQVGAE